MLKTEVREGHAFEIFVNSFSMPAIVLATVLDINSK